MNALRSGKLAAILALFLIVSVALGGCKKTDTVEEPQKSKDKLAAVLIDAKLKGNNSTVLSYSVIDYNKLFEEIIAKRGENPSQVYKQLTLENSQTVNSYIDYVKVFDNNVQDTYTAFYGTGYTVTYEITNSYNYTAEEIQDFKTKTAEDIAEQGFSSSDYFDPNKVSEVYEVEYTFEYSGIMHDRSGRDYIVLCKYDGVWKYAMIDELTE